jgi:hypothetical protein
MESAIDRKQCIFLAPLDTVLRQPPNRYDPLLRFFALLNPHLVVTDTQLLDNAIFQRGSIRRHLSAVFKDDSGVDDLPLFIVSQRAADRTLIDILTVDMAKAGGRVPGPPMRFSSMSSAQRKRLYALWKQGRVTEWTLDRDVGYDVRFARRVSGLVSGANYAADVAWPPGVTGHGNYHRLFCDILACQSLYRQAGIKGRTARLLMKRLIAALATHKPHGFTRTTVYEWLDAGAQRITGQARFQALDQTSIQRVRGVIRAAADYAYLRNFADRSGFTMLVDNTHWLASSIVNEELQVVRPAAETADRLVEDCLDLEEISELGNERHWSLQMLLRNCGFNRLATWDRVMRLRRTASFADRLRGMEGCRSVEEAAERMRDHVQASVAALLKRRFDLGGFVVNIALGGLAGFAGTLATGGSLPQAALGFATGGGGTALAIGGKHIMSRGKQAFLIDRLANTVVREFSRRRSGRDSEQS